MSEPNGVTEHDDARARVFGVALPLLTPKASAITAFTLAVMSLLGQGSWTMAVQSFYGTSFAPRSYGSIVVAIALVQLAVALGALWLARSVTLRANRDTSWEDHLARAAVVVGGLGAVLALVTVVGRLI
ncbi:MAG: hypothetical protein ACXVXC_05280 [Nocardioidaceae bacterium]